MNVSALIRELLDAEGGSDALMSRLQDGGLGDMSDTYLRFVALGWRLALETVEDAIDNAEAEGEPTTYTIGMTPEGVIQ